MLGVIILGTRDWLWPVFLVACASILYLVWRAITTGLDVRSKWITGSAKVVSVCLLLLCLLEPLWSGQRAKPGANLFAIVADSSQSLTIHDPQSSVHRGKTIESLLDEKSAWQIRLAQDFDVRRYWFDSQLRNVTTFGESKFDGTSSNIKSVLSNLKERFRDRPLAGVLLLTDGLATDLRDTSIDPAGLPPIYPVVIGSSKDHRDLSISHLTLNTTAFEDAPVTIQTDVSQLGLPAARVTAKVLDESGAIVKQETQSFQQDGLPLPFRFQIRPAKTGLSFYEVQVELDEPKGVLESTLLNNRRLLAVDRGSGPYRVLYLSGRPNWEYKFLHRALESDEQVQLTGVIRIARREPKFEWRSRTGESTNPLFRGFDQTSEQTERYDQPVLVRLNTRDSNELREGFPKTAEHLFEFHAVIIDDLEAAYFTADQLSLLERFVSERGGGLLMLGGTESFRQGAYARTPIGRMLPCYLEDSTSKEPSSEAPRFRFALTRDGWLQPWIRLRSTETEEQTRLGEMPSFRTLNRVGSIKPGGAVIAEVLDESGRKLPAV
ncbi:MAG: hypothetical protein FJ267_04665, partial [Planctomycetes bacterium]|nr:hypothetical protein [Planctomycetota bacterium]